MRELRQLLKAKVTKERLDVFISSDYENFKAERKQLTKEISKMKFFRCVPLEQRGAQGLLMFERLL